MSKRSSFCSILVPSISFAVAMALAISPSAFAAQSSIPKDDPLTSSRTKWFRDAKFGMFIHWGIYSVAAGTWKGKRIPGLGEWIMHTAHIPVNEYERLASQFNPTKFNADEWTSIARDAGMKYMVITSKHHDGFCMFDSKLTTYDIVDRTPYGKDVMKPLSRACADKGIHFCFYYSILDWHHPDAKSDKNFPKYEAYMRGQIKELLTHYGPIGILWFDGDWIPQWTPERAKSLEQYVRSLQPQIIINDRIGKRNPNAGDYATPEQHIPNTGLPGRLWETCMTMNNTWGYKSYDNHWKPTGDLIRKLIDIASKGGNFLLNVGPTAQGVIPEPCVVRLRQIGQWLRKNGEAIYGTKGGPFRRYSFNGRATVKGNTLYVFVFDWGNDGVVEIPGLIGEISQIRTVDTSLGNVAWRVERNGRSQTIVLHRPGKIDPYATVVAIELAAPPKIDPISYAVKPDRNGVLWFRAREAEIAGKTARYESGGGRDDIGYWTNPKDYVRWIFKLDRKGNYETEITYACPNNEAGSSYVVKIDGQTLKGKVASTGSWTEFKKEKLGAVTIEKGLHTVEVHPTKFANTALMNLKSVRLIPTQ